MPDRVDRGFDGLKRAGAPDLWAGIRSRTPSGGSDEPGPARRAAISVVALAVGVAGLAVGYAAFRNDGARPAPTVSGPVRVGGEPAPTDGAGDGSVTYQDPDDAFSVTYPSDWIRAQENLTPRLVDPQEILSLGTFPMSADGPRSCEQFPAPAIEDTGPGDAFVSIQERREGDIGGMHPPRPTFGPTSGSMDDVSPECLRAPKEFSHWWIPFSDQGRALYAYVAMGAEVSEARAAGTWAILNSLRFDPPTQVELPQASATPSP